MKLFFFIALLLGSFITNAAPLEGSPNPAQRSFNKKFSSATEVSWSYSAEFIRADFMIGSQHATAFYTHDGQLMGLTRNISSLDLPLALQLDLKSEFEGYWISELFELSNDQGITYYVTVENADKKIVLKAQPGQHWSKFQKETKN